MTRRRDERGIALASVLWGMAALSLIAAAMLSSSMNAAHIARNSWTQLQAENAADTAIQRAIFSLFDPRADRRLPVDGTTQALTVNGQSVSVSIQDEAGRIDVNYANRDLLRDVFKAAGAPAQDADALADRVADWRAPGSAHNLNGATADDYRRAGDSYVPRGRPFQSTGEVGLVMGMTPALFARIEPALTVYSHSPNFDMRAAPREVLMAIPGMDETKADQMVSYRAPPPAGAGLYYGLVNPIGHAFTITATTADGGAHMSRQAIVMVSGDPAHPVWVLDWK
jgi:general secretion pathway protein K